MKKVYICVLLIGMNFISCTPTQIAQTATEQATGDEMDDPVEPGNN